MKYFPLAPYASRLTIGRVDEDSFYEDEREWK
jgi:hypothetical protein